MVTNPEDIQKLEYFRKYPGNPPGTSTSFRQDMEQIGSTIFIFDYQSGAGASRLWTCRQNYVIFWYEDGYIGHTYRAEFRKTGDLWYVRTVRTGDDLMITLNTRFDVTKKYSDSTPLEDGDKQLLEGYNRFVEIGSIVIKYKSREGNINTTIIKDFQPNAQNGAYCFFHLVSDNDNSEYMIIIDINNAWYYAKKLTA